MGKPDKRDFLLPPEQYILGAGAPLTFNQSQSMGFGVAFSVKSPLKVTA
jgi:hypothetical protein